MDFFRSQLIVNYINSYTYASVSELCEYFHVSSATMRRDLATLEKQGMIIRVHGGARKLTSEDQRAGIPYDVRNKAAIKEKTAIAEYVSKIIEPNDTVFLDSSTTLLKAAQRLVSLSVAATIVTNDFLIADIINASSRLDLIFIGGYVEKHFNYTKGSFAENMLKNLYVDKTIIAFDNIDLNKGITMKCMNFVRFKQLALNHANMRFAVGDHNKFNSKGDFQICELSDLDAIITDSNLSDNIYKEYLSAGYSLIKI